MMNTITTKEMNKNKETATIQHVTPNLPSGMGPAFAAPVNTNDLNLPLGQLFSTDFEAQKSALTPHFGFGIGLNPRPKRKVGSPLDISKVLTQDELYRVAYLPFVIAEVVWDYVDSICDLACIMRLQPTKKLCRAIKELRREYDHSRAPFIDGNTREIETEHMIYFQDELKEYFNKLGIAVKFNLRQRHGHMEEDSEMLVCAVHMAMICFKALRKYTRWADDLIESKCGRTNHSIMPDQIRRLGILLPEFAGDCAIDLDTPEMDMWRDTLYNHIHSIEFTGVPNNN